MTHNFKLMHDRQDGIFRDVLHCPEIYEPPPEEFEHVWVRPSESLGSYWSWRQQPDEALPEVHPSLKTYGAKVAREMCDKCCGSGMSISRTCPECGGEGFVTEERYS